MHFIVGLGNPGEEYENTRHNTGRMAVSVFVDKNDDKKVEKNVKILLPDTFMNHSGKYVAKFIKSKKAAQNLIVVYDDIDLPLGTIKISYNKSSGGHNGVESIIKSLKTREFTRVRIGISKATPKGKVKKPGAGDLPAQAGKKVLDFLLGKWKENELVELKKVFKISSLALKTLILEGRDRAMNLYN